jgi:hypothetical protein
MRVLIDRALVFDAEGKTHGSGGGGDGGGDGGAADAKQLARSEVCVFNGVMPELMIILEERHELEDDGFKSGRTMVRPKKRRDH